MLDWKLYPMVGEIFNKQAVVLYELYNKDLKVSYTINQNNIYSVDNVMTGPTKTILSFKEDGVYTIDWYIQNQFKYKHRIIINDEVVKLIVVSCDFLEADTKDSLWDVMMKELFYYQRVAILHLGDQIYGDAEYKQCQELENRYKNRDGLKEQLNHYYYDLYSHRYCETFKPHHNILSATSNYYVWDDHEICNDAELNLNNPIHLMATQCYLDYQLSFSLSSHNPLTPFCWFTMLTPLIGMLSIERTSSHIPMESIMNCIKQLDCQKLILCFSYAFLPAPINYYGQLYTHLKGHAKFMNQDELTILLKFLFEWMGNSKKVIITSGDLHLGIHGSYQHENQMIPLLVSSPISNHPSLDRKLIAKGFKNETITLNHDIKLVVESAKARRCYGVIDLNEMTTSMQYSLQSYPKHVMKYIHAMLQF